MALVEAEKTALIGAGFIPEYNWLATGGRSGVNDRVNILQSGGLTLLLISLPADSDDQVAYDKYNDLRR